MHCRVPESRQQNSWAHLSLFYVRFALEEWDWLFRPSIALEVLFIGDGQEANRGRSTSGQARSNCHSRASSLRRMHLTGGAHWTKVGGLESSENRCVEELVPVSWRSW